MQLHVDEGGRVEFDDTGQPRPLGGPVLLRYDDIDCILVDETGSG
jgi:hypothetical protein